MGGALCRAATPPLLVHTCHLHLRHGPSSFYSFDRHQCFYFVQSLHPPFPFSPCPPLCSLSSSPLPPPSSLCILDHFLSFQVSGPVEADDPSPGGAGPPHCLRSVSLSLCSRYAHSPHPVRVGGRGRGAGRPQARRRGHLLQQQTLMMLLVPFHTSTHDTHTHTYTWKTSRHTHTCSTHTTAHCRQHLTGSQPNTWFIYRELKPT